MNPHMDFSQAIRNFKTGRGAGIVDGRYFIRAIQGMEFLAQTGSWDPKDQAAVKRWFQDYLHWLTTSDNANSEKRSGNNHATWWTAQVAAIAGFVEDDTQQKMAFNYYREHIFPRQIKSDGSAPHEEAAPAPCGTPPSIWKRSPPPAGSPRSGARTCGTSAEGRRHPGHRDRLPSAIPLRPEKVDEGPGQRVFQRRPRLPGLRRHGHEETRVHRPIP